VDSDYGQRYRDLYERHWWWRAREGLVLREIARIRPPGGSWRVLDVGCGAGLFFDRLAGLGASVEGVEPDAAIATQTVTDAGRIHVRPFDLSFEGGPFDLILMLDVLEHMSDAPEAVAHAQALLNPGGTLLVTVPAFRWLWTSHDDLNQHVTRYRAAELGNLLTSTDLEIKRLRYFFRWAVMAKLIVRGVEAISGPEPKSPRVPWGPVNQALLLFSRLEELVVGWLPIPLGTSILAIGRKRDVVP
jgi:SAM-dependent methyltransferase